MKKEKTFPKPAPKVPGVEYFDIKQYKCWLTGIGNGQTANPRRFSGIQKAKMLL